MDGGAAGHRDGRAAGSRADRAVRGLPRLRGSKRVVGCASCGRRVLERRLRVGSVVGTAAAARPRPGGQTSGPARLRPVPRRAWPDHDRLRRLSSGPRRPAIDLGPAADRAGLHGTAGRRASGCGFEWRPATPPAPERAGDGKRLVVVGDQSPRPRRFAAVPAAADRATRPGAAMADAGATLVDGARSIRPGHRTLHPRQGGRGVGPRALRDVAAAQRPHAQAPAGRRGGRRDRMARC